MQPQPQGRHAFTSDLTGQEFWLVVDKGYTPNYDYALQAMKDIPYNRWRTFNPEDTIRFYALTLHGVGMVKSTPDEIIKQGTDWRFLNELKAEMPVLPTPQASSS